MTINEATGVKTRPTNWKRNLNEVRREFENAKDQLYIFGHPANRPESEAYYQYWRGVRNALMWVLYNLHEDINSTEEGYPWK